MKFYNLKCEVPGGLGVRTVFDKSVIPWEIEKLHLIIEGWLGGNILTVSSSIIVTKELSDTLKYNYSGIKKYKEFELELSENFKILQPKLSLPQFERMIIGNNLFNDDFALGYYNNLYNQLIISEKAKLILDKFDLGNHSIELIETSSPTT